jgi:enoyl-CoA hydratase/carnithine racemase
MPVQQTRMHITTDDGVATLWMNGGSEFRFDDLAELARQLELLQRIPALDLIVLRADADTETSCFWLSQPILIQPDEVAADRFARLGTELLATLRHLAVPTLAFIEGACTGLGLELALSCDERFGISGPTANYGFGPTPTAWGGRTRATELFGMHRSNGLFQRFLTARQAHRSGVLDRVCCQRRAKIDLQSWIHHRQQNPIGKRQRRWWMSSLEKHRVAERQAFRRAALDGMFVPAQQMMETINPLQALCNVAFVGDHPHWPILAREWSLRRVQVQCVGFEFPSYADAISAGRVTPLEAASARERLLSVPDAVELRPAELVLLDDHTASMAVMLERDLPARTLLVLPEASARRLQELALRPQRVLGWHWQPEGYEFTGHDSATLQLSAWFAPLNVPHAIRAMDTDRYDPVDATPLDIGYDGYAETQPSGITRATPTSLHTD